MNLHHFQTSVFSDNALSLYLQYSRPSDTILLAGDAVNAIMSSQWRAKLAGKNVRVLTSDLQARGLNDKLAAITDLSIQVIDYNEFVQLTLTHDKVITW
ncbi:sulfurtransferase complex subunit TusB [Shewanella maritima]|uniref:sulfurtransferase complex subunit TusB n=1 Tax=Shewanella maritima TaxID=2520507 RepID=UPI0037355093